jgi:DNA-binding PucR family transcriptional regulator
MERRSGQAVRVDRCAEELRDAVAGLAEHAADVADDVAHTILLELPELSGPELAAGVRASTIASIDAFVSAIDRGGDPATVPPPTESLRFARDVAHAGVPFTTLLRKYRIGQAAFSRHLLDQLGAQIDDRAIFEEAVRRANEFTFTFIDHIADAIVGEYQREREVWQRSAAALQAETVAAILDGRLTDPVVAGRRLRHELDRRQLAFVVWRAEDAEDERVDALERVAREVASALGCSHPLLVATGRRSMSGWLASAGPFEMAALDRPALPCARDAGAKVAVGEPAFGLEGFRSSHLEARGAQRVAELMDRAPGSIVRYDSVALASMVVADLDQARRFVERELGPLLADDDASRRVAGTLRVYLEERASPVRTARRLGIHQNTVAHRIRRVEELLGRSVGERTLELQVALKLLKVVAPSG